MVPTKELIKMADLVLKNNFFKFNGELKKQISGTAIGTKFTPSYVCIYTFLCLHLFTPSYVCIFMDTYFLHGLMEKKNSFSFLMDLITSTLI